MNTCRDREEGRVRLAVEFGGGAEIKNVEPSLGSFHLFLRVQRPGHNVQQFLGLSLKFMLGKVPCSDQKGEHESHGSINNLF